MRTTITLDDTVFRAFKKPAERGTTFSQQVKEALTAWRRLELESVELFVLITGGEGGLRDGVDINSNVALGQLLDEENPRRAW